MNSTLARQAAASAPLEIDAEHPHAAPAVAEPNSAEDRVVIGQFCALMVLVMGAIAFGLRLGTSSAAVMEAGAERAVLGGIGLGLLACTAPVLLAEAARRHSVMRLIVGATAPVMILAAASAIGWFADELPNGSVHVASLAAVALGTACVLLVLMRGRGFRQVSAATAATAVTLSIWLASVSWGGDLHGALFEVRLALGTAHVDTLFHASIANMLLTYGQPSTGLDGPQAIPYHFLSHLLFGSLSRLFGCSVLAVYNLTYPIAFLPLFVYTLLDFAVALGRSPFVGDLRANARLALAQCGFFWAFALVGFVGILPMATALHLGVWDNVFRGESFTLSMACMFMTGSLLVRALRKREIRPGRGDIYWPYLYVVGAAMLAITGLLKISVLFVVAAAIGYAFVRFRGYRQLGPWIALVGFGVILAVVHGVTRGADGDQLTLYPFHFLRTHVPEMLRPFSALFFFWWVLLYLALRIVEERCSTVEEALAALGSRRLVDVEVAFAVAVASTLPGALFALPSGAANYFSEVHRWLTFALVLSAVLRIRPRLFPLQRSRAQR